MSLTLNSTNGQYAEWLGAMLSAYPFTMACWRRSTSNAALLSNVSVSNQNTSARFSGIFAHTNQGIRVHDCAASTSNGALIVGNADNGWHHCGGVWSASNSRTAYLDGSTTASSSTSVAGPFPLTVFNLGAYYNGATRFSTTLMDIAEVAVWNTGLAASDFVDLAAGKSPALVRPDALIAYYPLGGRFGESANDIWGGKNLTLYGSPSFTDHPTIHYPQPPLRLLLRGAR